MRQLDPLTDEEKHKICKECGGFCCNYFFIRPGGEDAGKDFHLFRGRKLIRYGNTTSVIIPDSCPYSKDGDCSVYENRPEVCRKFPSTYSPFWNLRCKLQRELYKRGEIRKNTGQFQQIKAEIYKTRPKKYLRVLKF